MRTEYTLTGDQQLAMLREFLTSEAVRDRPPGLQRDHDELIGRALREGELALAMSLWTLAAYRSAGIARVAAGLLMSHINSREVNARVRAVLGTDRVH